MFRLWAFFAVVFLFANGLEGDEKWKWSDHASSILHSFMKASSNYETQLVRRPMADWREVEVRISNGKETLHKWKAHGESPFVFSDSIVVYAKFSMISSGCEIRAYDLDQQKEVWRKRLKGIGMVGHSKYRNRINMEIRKDHIVVYGNESAGQYIEVREVKTGELISNTVGTERYKRFKTKK